MAGSGRDGQQRMTGSGDNTTERPSWILRVAPMNRTSRAAQGAIAGKDARLGSPRVREQRFDVSTCVSRPAFAATTLLFEAPRLLSLDDR